MIFKVINHPLVAHKLRLLRSTDTTTVVFRMVTNELVTLLAYEATTNVKTETVTIETPVAPTTGVRLARNPRPIIVPVLRAGLGMLDGMIQCMPTAEVGFLGMRRDEETLVPETYANRLPDDLTGRQCYIIDPMLATGGTLIDTVNYLVERGATDITAICMLAAPEGVEALRTAAAEHGNALKLAVFTASLDDCLNEHGYIVPGLGDAGDRLYGYVD
ncbi:MAG: uracil phosphoribosyltransferase [Coriobacteriales bacterium]|jgi:uracil phosphoribosyltransferase|nr:uracil phosphoribosyltransferase [Coriobacteriales bacterium]